MKTLWFANIHMENNILIVRHTPQCLLVTVTTRDTFDNIL